MTKKTGNAPKKETKLHLNNIPEEDLDFLARYVSDTLMKKGGTPQEKAAIPQEVQSAVGAVGKKYAETLLAQLEEAAPKGYSSGTGIIKTLRAILEEQVSPPTPGGAPQFPSDIRDKPLNQRLAWVYNEAAKRFKPNVPGEDSIAEVLPYVRSIAGEVAKNNFPDYPVNAVQNAIEEHMGRSNHLTMIKALVKKKGLEAAGDFLKSEIDEGHYRLGVQKSKKIQYEKESLAKV